MANPHASPHGVSAVPLLVKAEPISMIALPGSDGQPGSEVAKTCDGPIVEALVPDGIKRYEGKTR